MPITLWGHLSPPTLLGEHSWSIVLLSGANWESRTCWQIMILQEPSKTQPFAPFRRCSSNYLNIEGNGITQIVVSFVLLFRGRYNPTPMPTSNPPSLGNGWFHLLPVLFIYLLIIIHLRVINFCFLYKCMSHPFEKFTSSWILAFFLDFTIFSNYYESYFHLQKLYWNVKSPLFSSW